MSIAICICTCKRNNYLEKLLKSIEDGKKPNGYNIGVIIVDNDPHKGAEPIYLKFKNKSDIDYFYYCEKSRGISYARNSSIKLAYENNFDLLSFLDDDEVVDESWLTKFIELYEKNEDKIIIGKVEPVFEHEIEDWIQKGSFFVKEKAPLTANSLMNIDVLKLFVEPLSIKYALTGGSDTHLKLRLKMAGFNFIYSDEVIVKETIPKSRANAIWLIKRAFRTGYTSSLIEVELLGIKGLIKRLGTAVFRFLQFITLILPSMFKGKSGVVKSLCNLSKSFGILYGIVGGKYYEYKTIHGK